MSNGQRNCQPCSSSWFTAALRTAQPPLDSHCCAGLGALRNNSRMIELKDCIAVGSVDVDTVLSQQYPNDPRWDFVIGVQSMGAAHKELIWIEVHPASSDSISAVLAKLEWLKGWLKNNGGPTWQHDQ